MIILVNLENILIHISFFILFFVTLLHWANLIIIKNEKMSNLAQKSMIIAFICMTGFLLTRWFYSRHLPLSNLYESFMFLSWSLCLIHTIMENQSKNDWLSVITAPSIVLTYGFATLGLPKEMQQSTTLVPALQSHWLMMHVSMMILSYASLLCGSLLAITFLITASREINLTPLFDASIKTYFRLFNSRGCLSNTSVSLSVNRDKNQLTQQLDHWSYRIISLGFPLLTTGIPSGAVWANEVWGSYWNWDPKETWALVTWLVSATYLHARITKGWQGKKPAIVASSGFFTVWIRYSGVNPLGRGLHSYGWLIRDIIQNPLAKKNFLKTLWKYFMNISMEF